MSLRPRAPRGTEDAAHILGRASQVAESGEPAAAVALYRQLAEAGNAEAAFKLGLHLEAGLGALQNFADATAWFRTAADLGWTPAFAKLGDIYFSGRMGIAVESEAGETAVQRPGSALQALAAPSLVRPDFILAAEWNGKAAALGDPRAQVRLAFQYAAGLGLPQDYRAAAKWFYEAALQKDPAGQLGVGMILAGGHGRPRDVATAVQWLRRSAAQGNANAKLCLAVLLIEGDGIERDLIAADRLLEEAAEARLVAAMFLLGEHRRLGVGRPVDESAAETWLKRAALLGQVEAMHALATLYRNRRPPDYASAASYYREAADLGFGPAQFTLGELYARGLGVPQDGTLAAHWFEKAAEQGVTAAYERLGAMYADGVGLDQDFSAAARWYARAAEGGGNTDYELGVLHHGGLGVPKDVGRAMQLFRKASRAGDARASLRLGIAAAEGLDVPQNWEIAAHFYGVAAAQGSEDAELNLAYLLIRNLTTGGPAAGVQILEEAADAGSGKALWSLYALFRSGDYVEKDSDRADVWLAKGVERGVPRLVTEAVRRLRASDGVPVPREAALERLTEAARSGDAEAQALLGLLYAEGDLLPRDQAEAVVWMTRAGNRGSAFAQAWLGDVLSRGQGVPRNVEEGARWYRRAGRQGHTGALLALTAAAPPPGSDPAEDEQLVRMWLDRAELGDALAERMVGHFLVHGERSSKDAEAGARWLRRASAHGNSAAQLLLASLIARGEVKPSSPAEVAKLLSDAAAAGRSEASLNLARCYELGAAGLPLDPQAALLWYRRAAAQDNPEAQDLLLARLSARTDKASREEAERWRSIIRVRPQRSEAAGSSEPPGRPVGTAFGEPPSPASVR